jgi:hypothetical protein
LPAGWNILLTRMIIPLHPNVHAAIFLFRRWFVWGG